jgi:hypothetical protein
MKPDEEGDIESSLTNRWSGYLMVRQTKLGAVGACH